MPAAYIIRMEYSFSDLRQKDVINVTDGKHLGRVCDMKFTFPENKIIGFTVTGSKSFKFSRQEIFVPVSDVQKIGKDAVLVNLSDGCPKPPKPPKPPRPPHCPPPFAPNCPPDCPPNCPPDRPPQPPYDRRSYDEYE